MKSIKVCGWISFAEKIICIVLLLLILLVACSCMAVGEGCAANSMDRVNSVDEESVTAGYEVLGNIGSFVAGSMTWAAAVAILMLAVIPLIIYIITGVINIIGLVRLRQAKTGVISANAVISIIVDVLFMVMYFVMLASEFDVAAMLVIMAFVGVLNIPDIVANAILLHNVSKLKKNAI